MPLTHTDYNAFAQGLAERFAERAKGLDGDSARLVNVYPSDHVLAGFLTPVQEQDTRVGIPSGMPAQSRESPDDAGASVEEALADDLPLDKPYEQTAIGMHWMVPRTELRDGVTLNATVEVRVYVRRLPTRVEQKTHGLWRVERSVADVAHAAQAAQAATLAGDAAMAAAGSASSLDATGNDRCRRAEVVPVWTGEEFPPIVVPPINLGELRRRRRLTLSLHEQMRAGVATLDTANLYPGRRSLMIEEAAIESDEAYEIWLAQWPPAAVPDNWFPVLDIRLVTVPTDPECARIAIRVINRTQRVGRTTLDFNDENLYGVRLTVAAPVEAHRPTIFQELPRSFRYDRQMSGVGINAHVELTYQGEQLLLQTNSVPIAAVDRLEPREIADALPSFHTLETDPLPTLRRILGAMRDYDAEQWVETLARLTGLEREEAERARAQFRAEIVRFQRGIELLADQRYPYVARAFALMNRAMRGATRGRYSEWRLFQIVFIVSQLPGLAGREYQELRHEDDDHVDILWFAAGGGKTEAFLGLIIWQAFFDRLRGKRLGVAAFVRFPLRLLTFQQLQRLGAAMGAAELIRRQEHLSGARFSMGYFVGRQTTPNQIDDDAHRRFVGSGPDARLLRVFNCPFCESPTRLAYDAANRLVEHRCTSETCPGGADRLPVYVVDQDIYRFLPTVIVSTVDKLAQFGQNQRFAQLFGRFNLVCPVHGASFYGVNRACPAAVAFEKGERPAICAGSARAVDYGPFHEPAPALLVQDELHLLSEELGTFDSHYETAVMELARSLSAEPWKIIAATATIERYEQHAWQLYLRRARQFPGPGPQAYDSFYYRQNIERTGRIFVGILGVGRKHTPAVTRALSLMYLELQAARDAADQNLATACTRLGLRLLAREEFAQLVFYYELVLTYVLTRKGSDQVAEAIESRVKRELRDLVPQHGELLIDTFNGGVAEAEMSNVIERIRTSDPGGNPADRVRGVVTTNVIGHGVDVDRFNVIIFAGFPRLAAEYIQASARVGRTFPGISVFVATPQSERDRSVFDRFAKFHEYLDRLVDPSAVIRWPEPALSRTVPGILAGYLMGVAAAQLGRPIYAVEQVQDNYGRVGAEALESGRIVAWMEDAYGGAHAPSERYRDQVATTVQNQYSSIVNRPRIAGTKPHNLNTYLAAMQSLRDTDDPASIRVGQDPDATILKRLLRA